MFTAFLTIVLILSIFLGCFVISNNKVSQTAVQSELATIIASIRYCNKLQKELTDGLAVLEVTKEKNDLVEQLMQFIEVHKIPDAVKKDAVVISLDEVRSLREMRQIER